MPHKKIDHGELQIKFKEYTNRAGIFRGFKKIHAFSSMNDLIDSSR